MLAHPLSCSLAWQAKRLEAEYARKLEASQAHARAALASELHRLSMEKERAVEGVREELTRQQREQEERCVQRIRIVASTPKVISGRYPKP